MTRSVPLMMNTPFSVMIGKSPRKTCCSLISPVEPVHEPGGDEQRLGVVGVALLGVFETHLRLAEAMIRQFEGERAGEILDRD